MQHHAESSFFGCGGFNATTQSPLQLAPFNPFVFFSGSGGEAFGFVDPAHIIRGCHLIPAFSHGRTDEYLPPSIVRDPEGDWRVFYANR